MSWRTQQRRAALSWLREGREPPDFAKVVPHYSPCDEGCRHADRPLRWRDLNTGNPADAAWHHHRDGSPAQILILEPGYDVEASWRPVDVRCLSWPHDLRPEMLAVLCLRCWAVRT